MAGLMTAGNIYVHYNPKNVQSYKLQKEDLLEKYDINMLKGQIAKLMAKKNVNLTNKDIANYFNLLSGFDNANSIQSQLQKALVNTTEKLITASSNFNLSDGTTTNLYGALQQAIKNPSNQILQDINSQLKKLLAQITSQGVSIDQAIINRDILDALQKGFFSPINQTAISAQVSSKGQEYIKNIYDQLKTKIFTGTTAIKVSNTASELAGRTNLIRAMAGLITLLDQQKTGTINLNSDNPVLQDYLKVIINAYDSTLGFAFQTMISKFEDIQVDNLLVEFAETGNNQVKVKYNSKVEGEKFTVSTTDISMSVDMSKQKKQASVLTKFNLPGISVKLGGGLLNGKSSNITLRQRQVNINTLMHDIDNHTLSAVFNILTHYNRTKNKNISTSDYINMWSAFKIGLVINALIGQATTEDFSYFFIAGNKVYNIIEIITEILKGDGENNTSQFSINMAQKPKLIPSQEEIRKNNKFEKGSDTKSAALIRSQKQVDYIMTAKIVAGIKLKVRQLNNI